MIQVILLATLTAAASTDAPSVGVVLKAAAAGERCRGTPVDAGHIRVPLFAASSEECPVASVGEEPIALRELAGALELKHLSARPGAAPSKRQMDFAPALDRLITTRLLVQEGREMGLDATPEFKRDVESYKASRMRSTLQRIAVKGVKPDSTEVERLYRASVRQWKLKSVLLETEDAAKAFEAALKAGEGFDAVAKRFVAEKKAKGGGPAEFVSPKHMVPEVRAAVEAAKPGVPTGVVKVPAGWAVLRVDGTRYPNDPAERAEARAASLARREREAVRAFYVAAVKKHAVVDEALLKSIDFEANGEKGFAALLEDQRPLATIRGEKPLTVADLTGEVSAKFFHGIDAPIRDKKVNREKDESFERLLGARVFAKEAALRKLEQRPELRREVADYERALVFNTFIEKVIVPEVKVTEEEATREYEARKADYTAPEMFKLDGVAFGTAREAQSALDKLTAGTDFTWLRSSLPGQLPPERCSLRFDGSTVSASALPADLRKTLTGATAGAYRLYAARPDEVYVLRVTEQRPPAPQPYVEAREKIAKKLYNDKLVQAMGDYAGKLRKVQRVDVYVARVAA
jgi:parvulin-like peptidyl-prolyl isomerase